MSSMRRPPRDSPACPRPLATSTFSSNQEDFRPRRARSSRRNSSGGTKNGFSCRMPPMITIGCVLMMSITTLAPNWAKSYVQTTASS